MIGLVLIVLILLVLVGIVLTLAALIRRSVPREVLRTNNEAAVTYLTVIGVIYGVFLAFVIFSLWEQRTNAQDHVETESSQLYVLFRLAREFPAPAGPELIQEIMAYNKEIVSFEWPLMANVDLSELERRSSKLDRIWEDGVHFRPLSPVEQALYNRVLEASEKACIARRMRLLDAEAALGSLLWTLVIVGGIATIVPTLFIHVEHRGFLVVAKTCMITLLVLTVYTIYDLQRPFRGSWPVKPRSYILIQERMEQVLSEQPSPKSPVGMAR
jgi:hypothetical protein